MDQGTGAVHTAPGHGADDISQRRNTIYRSTHLWMNEEDLRRMLNILPEQFVFDANPKIVNLLREQNRLLHSETFVHTAIRIVHVVIIRFVSATEQWFISMEKLREKASRRNQTDRMAPSMGRRADVQHDRIASGLDDLTSTRLGCANYSILLRLKGLQRASE